MTDLVDLIQDIEKSLNKIETGVRNVKTAEPTENIQSSANDDELKQLMSDNQAMRHSQKQLAEKIDQTINRLKAIVGS